MARKRKEQPSIDGYNKAFPARLRYLLDKNRTTQKALAEHLGVTHQSVAAYCSGASTPTWENIAEIARFFSCSSDYLLGLSEYRTKDAEWVTASELGLSESAVTYLQGDLLYKDDNSEIISALLSTSDFYLLCQHISEYRKQVEKAIEIEKTGEKIKSKGRYIPAEEMERYMLYKLSEDFTSLLKEPGVTRWEELAYLRQKRKEAENKKMLKILSME